MSAIYDTPTDPNKDEHVYSRVQPASVFTEPLKHLPLGLLLLLVVLTSAVLGVSMYSLLAPKDEDQSITDGLLSRLLLKGPCNDSWIYYDDSCYIFKQYMANWSKSAAHCETLGARLIEIDDQQENDFVRVALLHVDIATTWLGVNDHMIQDKFVLPSGAPIRYLNFDMEERKSKHCVVMEKRGTWGGTPCSRPRYVSCEKHIV